ncbi:ABC transporter substrate-binding protein [Rhodoplanes sp. TEM]|uniref:ABC transporter substrate-binding protein n=1 Tax=Rhodoplanes tepidamans TaxID=200616 RepID=A0ABT5J7U7_RHOTP|nr:MULTISPECIES: ABC transporter substrate-binding protein [Rhodoplanes]MDC7785731.1 ABC transporter substrate-binding protein [Rhodoplanes tepidamans]MDC7986303.1 ABC transporter substrate-binding protein [Rhodoplanes sp. TEM]MDQ0354707.1 iron complex transport system substrate-binding protein [Rhodoplanes tepidamans]
MTFSRRTLLRTGAAAALGTLLPRRARAARDVITVTDVLGRRVEIARPVKRIVLGEGRQLITLALVHPDPVSLLAGWPGDLVRQDKVTYGQYREKFPAIADIPIVGRGSEESFSIEQALATAPDVAILSGGYGPSIRSKETIARFEAAGVPVVFIDLIAKPLDNIVPSLRLLGRLLGREEAAEKVVQFNETRTGRIRDRLAATRPVVPTVLMNAHAGLNECCNAPGRATIGAFIDVAGGHNIAADVLKTPFGPIGLEYVLGRDPEIYVGTGGQHLAGTGGLVLGPGVDAAESRARLQEIVSRPGLADLSAVRNGRVHGLWHLFGNFPLNVLALEALARWFHPKLFGDVDPDASLAVANQTLLAVPMRGTYWVSLNPPPGGR